MKKILSLTLVLALLVSMSGCFYLDRISSGENAFSATVLSSNNPYSPYFDQYYDYIFPDSDSRYLSWQDVAGLSYREVYLAEQEIYARCGREFEEWDLQEYFSAREWYVPAAPERELSEYASMNAFFLDVYAAVVDGSIYNLGNPYIALCSQDFLLSASSIRELTASDLQGLSSKELAIARNEIFARHGYIFSDPELRTYFYTKSWYRPASLSSNFDFGSLSDLETANVELIQAYEDGKYGPVPGDNTGNQNNNGNGGNQNNNGNSDNTGSIPSHVTMVDKYTYLMGTSCYHIPYVDIPSASAINQKMYNDCYSLLRDNVFAYPDSILLWSMTYTIGRYGDVVSVLVYCEQDWGSDVILVYNFSASTGRKLSNNQVYEAYGLSAAAGQEALRNAIALYWEAYINKMPVEHRGIAEECRDKTLAESNMANWTPYINANGALCFTGRIYSIAGAEYYTHSLDQQGNDISGLDCTVH